MGNRSGTSPARWESMVEFARWMRAKPAFDVEERDYRLTLAEAVRGLLDAARDRRPLAEPAEAVWRRHLAGLDPVLPPRQVGLLSGWATLDEEGLARALRGFCDGGENPDGQVLRFAEAVQTSPVAERFGAGGLAIGSLLAFAGSPESQPILSPGRLDRLREVLREESVRSPDLRERYRQDLEFMRRVESDLRRAGVPVRDMVDVESLTTLSASWQELWAGDGAAGGGSRRTTEPEVYLAACLMYRNEADHLAEWIEFHRLVGVERFFLYDNQSTDHQLDVLAPYLEEGIVVRHEWPGSSSTRAELGAVQELAYNHCLAAHTPEARWIAFIDSDEFLFSPTGRPISEILPDYERSPGVVVNCAPFGTSGHVSRPEGLVIETYKTRFEGEPAALRRIGMPGRASQVFKTIVDPAAVRHSGNLHAWVYRSGAAVDENGYPVGSRHIFTKSTSFERIRINHYFARSEADLRAKYAIREAPGETLPASTEVQRMNAGIQDEAISSYVPRLREALRRRGAPVPSM